MISKKNKALSAAILAAAMSATSVVPAFASAGEKSSYATESTYAEMFSSLYDDVITNGEKNGYLSKNNNGSGSFGIPYHARETLVIEAPDYGHETTSEAMSYIAWVTAMHDVLAKKGVISGSTGDLQKGWKTLEAIIPGWSTNAYGADTQYNTFWDIAAAGKIKADALSEQPSPEDYPDKQQKGGDAYNPIAADFASAYGSDNGYYLMHWLADVDDWYGFGGGTPGGNSGQFTFINTFQRGEEESCFETVPQPCLEELKYGMETPEGKDDGNGIKAIFNGIDKVPKQYAFTNAPDAEDRAIQAIYFASMNGLDCGDLTGLAAKMGDQCRNDMFDKYYKALGCQSMTAPSEKDKEKSQHYLMAWYTSWGGQLEASWGKYEWAWQIGCSHAHQFYQNPLAAYALAYDKVMSKEMKAKSAVDDYKMSFKRQIEFYLWLQSANGPFAGGATNSKNGNYSKYDSSDAMFNDMVYVEHPVYADPGSNHWIGNQVWATQRLAELYYYVCRDGDLTGGETFGGLSLKEALEALLDRWVEWFVENTQFNYTDEKGNTVEYAIPSNLDWSGKPADWNGTYDPSANSGLTCKITGYGQGDLGCVSSLCNTLIYYAKAKDVPATAAMTDDNTDLAAKGLRLANKLMGMQWELGRDEYGISFEDCNGSLKRVFQQEVYIPSKYHGTMPDGSKLENGATFASIREIYAQDPMYQELEKAYEASGKTSTEGYKYHLHRFWHEGDALMTMGNFALLYPDVKPYTLAEFTGDTPSVTPTEPPVTPTDAPQPTDPPVTPTAAPQPTDPPATPTSPAVTANLWGDATCNGVVDLADALLILQNVANANKYPITPQGIANGDVVDNGGGLTGQDALALQMIDAKLLTQGQLPVKASDLTK